MTKRGKHRKGRAPVIQRDECGRSIRILKNLRKIHKNSDRSEYTIERNATLTALIKDLQEKTHGFKT